MAVENVDIRFRESGARVIKRKIDDIGRAANTATRGIFLLQRALYVLGAAGLLRGLANYADSLTTVENRLRLTSKSTENLEAVQKELFAVANRSRTSFGSIAEVYNRVALSARQLGISQKEAARFTESLAKAAIISGASNREANAALVQLGQGLASNRLSGDELRSVLEQLPFVADVIAKKLGITRGELRKFGTEGKISAEVVLDAFKDAQGEIDQLFAQTSPTIAQAFTIANNKLLEFIDALDDSTGASAAFAKAIINLADNIDILVYSVGLIATRFALAFTASVVGRIVAFAAAIRRAGGATAAFNAIEARRATLSLAARNATALDTASQVANLQARAAGATVRANAARQAYAEATAYNRAGRAYDVHTGRLISNAAARDRLLVATTRLNTAERAEFLAVNALTGARARLTAAETAAIAANSRLAAAEAAQATLASRLSRTFPLLTGAVRGTGTALGALYRTLFSNPYTAVVGLILAAVGALILWGNEIKVTEDKVVGLRDAALAAFQLMTEAIGSASNYIISAFQVAIDFISPYWSKIADAALYVAAVLLELWKGTLNFIIGLFVGAYNAIVVAWDNLPAALEAIGGTAINAMIDIIEFGVKQIIRGINTITNPIGAALDALDIPNPLPKVFDPESVDLGRYKVKLSTEAGDVGAAAASAFVNAFGPDYVGDAIGSIGDAIIERARQNIANRPKEEDLTGNERTPGTTTTGDDGKKGRKKKTFQDLLAEIEREIDVQKLSNREREIAEGLIKIEDELKRKLTDTERDLATEALKRLQISKDQRAILDELRGPQEDFNAQLAAANALLAEGKITGQEYAEVLRDITEAADRASNTLAGGFRAAISDSILSAGEFGEKIGGVVVGSIDAAADAIVEFAKTGKLNLRQLFSELFAQLLKLAAQQLLLQLVGSLVGVPGIGLAGGLTGGGGTSGLGGLLGGIGGFATGGSIMPTGPGNTDSQIVQFAKRPDERVDILTPAQQRAQEQGNNNAPPVVNQNNVNVAAVLSPKDIVGAFDQEGETVILNILNRNATTVRSIVNR